MKMYERIENNNFEEIDKDRAIELIKNGNGYLVYNQSYFDLQKENEKWQETYQEEKDKQFELIRKKQELEEKWDNDTHKLQNDLDIANAEIIELRKEKKELKKLMAHKNGYTKKLEEDLFKNCSNYVIPKDKIKEILDEVEITDFNSLVEMFFKINKLLESEEE